MNAWPMVSARGRTRSFDHVLSVATLSILIVTTCGTRDENVSWSSDSLVLRPVAVTSAVLSTNPVSMSVWASVIVRSTGRARPDGSVPSNMPLRFDHGASDSVTSWSVTLPVLVMSNG